MQIRFPCAEESKSTDASAKRKIYEDEVKSIRLWEKASSEQHKKWYYTGNVNVQCILYMYLHTSIQPVLCSN